MSCRIFKEGSEIEKILISRLCATRCPVGMRMPTLMRVDRLNLISQLVHVHGARTIV